MSEIQTPWTSKTNQFAPDEMIRLQQETAQELFENLMLSDPLVMLRAFLELIKNEDTDVLPVEQAKQTKFGQICHNQGVYEHLLLATHDIFFNREDLKGLTLIIQQLNRFKPSTPISDSNI